jgi:hypothetical protein
VQALELLVSDVVIDDCDAPGALRPELGERAEHDGVVRAIHAGLDEHRALDAQCLQHVTIGRK